MNLLNAIIAFGAFTAASANTVVTTLSCDKIKPNFLIGAESDQGGKLYFKVSQAWKNYSGSYKNNPNGEHYHKDIKRNKWMSSHGFDTPGAGAGTTYWWPEWKNNKVAFQLYNKGTDKIIITKWNIARCTKIYISGGCAEQSQITHMWWEDSVGYWCLSSDTSKTHHGKPCRPGISIYPGNHYGFERTDSPLQWWLWNWLSSSEEENFADSSSVSEIPLLPAPTVEMDVKDELDSISSECKSNEYSMALNVVSDPNLHFILSATSNVNDKEDNCPDHILLMSDHGEKSVLFLTDKKVAEISAEVNVISHQLGNVTLGDIIEAEKNVEPFDYEANYDLTQNSCFHYAQRIAHYLQLDETVDLGDFLVQNLLRNDALLEMAKKHAAKGGLRVISKFVSKDMYEKYVKDLVFSQLNIASEAIKIVPEATEDVSIVAV